MLHVSNPSGLEPEESWLSAVPSVWPAALQRFCLRSGRFRYDVARTAGGAACDLRSINDRTVPAFAAAIRGIPSLTAATLSNCGLTDAHLAALFQLQQQQRILLIPDRLPIATLLRTIATAPPSLRKISSSELKLFVDRTDRHLRLQAGEPVSPTLLLPVLDRYQNLLSLDMWLCRPASATLLAQWLAQCSSLRLLQITGPTDAAAVLELFAAAPPQLNLMNVGLRLTDANYVSMRRTRVGIGGEGSHSASAGGDASAAPPIRVEEAVRMQLDRDTPLGAIVDALARHQHITSLELDSKGPAGDLVALLVLRLPSLRRLSFTTVADEQTALQLLESAATSSPSLEFILHTQYREYVLVHLRSTSAATGSASAESSPSRALSLNLRGTAASDAVPAILQRIPRLAELDLSVAHLTEERLAAQLRACPGLRSLTLRHMGQIKSLACFSAGPSPLPLTHLTLTPPDSMSPRQLLHFRALPQLTHLSIFGRLADRLSDAAVAAFTPPSVVLPTLTHFACSGRMPGLLWSVESSSLGITDQDFRIELARLAGPDLAVDKSTARWDQSIFPDPDSDSDSDESDESDDDWQAGEEEEDEEEDDDDDRIWQVDSAFGEEEADGWWEADQVEPGEAGPALVVAQQQQRDGAGVEEEAEEEEAAEQKEADHPADGGDRIPAGSSAAAVSAHSTGDEDPRVVASVDDACAADGGSSSQLTAADPAVEVSSQLSESANGESEMEDAR